MLIGKLSLWLLIIHEHNSVGGLAVRVSCGLVVGTMVVVDCDAAYVVVRNSRGVFDAYVRCVCTVVVVVVGYVVAGWVVLTVIVFAV